jgi:hypothetical protein
MLVIQRHYNDSEKILRSELLDITNRLQRHTPTSLAGRGYRSGVLNSIKMGEWSEKKYTHSSTRSIGVDTISTNSAPVGLSMQVSHTDGGKAQLLDFEVLYRDDIVKGCIFITQTLAEAERRNKAANPDSAWGNTGNRIHFEYLVEQMESLQKFLKCPLAIIGVQSD